MDQKHLPSLITLAATAHLIDSIGREVLDKPATGILRDKSRMSAIWCPEEIYERRAGQERMLSRRLDAVSEMAYLAGATTDVDALLNLGYELLGQLGLFTWQCALKDIADFQECWERMQLECSECIQSINSKLKLDPTVKLGLLYSIVRELNPFACQFVDRVASVTDSMYRDRTADPAYQRIKAELRTRPKQTLIFEMLVKAFGTFVEESAIHGQMYDDTKDEGLIGKHIREIKEVVFKCGWVVENRRKSRSETKAFKLDFDRVRNTVL